MNHQLRSMTSMVGAEIRYLLRLAEMALLLSGPGGSFAAAPQAKPASDSQGKNVAFKAWRDPREDAFRLGVPVGWKISGGLARAASVDARPVVRAESPDGAIKVFFDDPDIRPRQVPDALIRQAGLREGQQMKAAWGGPILLARYQTGEQFARQYAKQNLCPNGQITQSGPIVDATREMNSKLQPLAQQQGATAQANVGEAYFNCGRGVGYTIANTILLGAARGMGAQLWFVHQLGSVIVSDPAQARFGSYVLHTMMETFALNPQWEARQAKTTQQVTASVTQMQQAMAQSIAQHAQRQASAASAGGFNHPNDTRLPTDLRAKWAREDVSRQKFSDATMGQKWMHNSATGENYRVDNAAQYQWVDHSRNVVNGPSDGSPPPGSHGEYTRLDPGWK